MLEPSKDPPVNALSASELILLALEGDEEAFTTLYLRYTPELHRYVSGLTHSREERDEVVAETFIKAWQKLVQLESCEHFRAWLYRIATNIARDWRRREKIRQKLSLEATGDDIACSHSFETIVEEAELAKLTVVPDHSLLPFQTFTMGIYATDPFPFSELQYCKYPHTNTCSYAIAYSASENTDYTHGRHTFRAFLGDIGGAILANSSSVAITWS